VCINEEIDSRVHCYIFAWIAGPAALEEGIDANARPVRDRSSGRWISRQKLAHVA
jgi:hypothetical protein